MPERFVQNIIIRAEPNGPFSKLWGVTVDDSPDPALRRRGRPVSLQSRAATLAAARQLLQERGLAGFTVDEVARRSGVGKATIYKHWPDGFHLAVEAFGDIVTDAVPTRSTGDAPVDLHDQFRRLAGFYASPDGAIAAQIIGAAAGQPDGSQLVRHRFFGRRRQETTTLVDSGQHAGQLRQDVTTDQIIDLVFAPIIFRLFNGQGPLPPDEAEAMATLVITAVRTTPGQRRRKSVHS